MHRSRSSIVVASAIALVVGVLTPAAANAAPPGTTAASNGPSTAQSAAAPSATPRAASPSTPASVSAPPTTAGLAQRNTTLAVPSWHADSPDAAAVPLTAASVVCVLTCDGGTTTGLASDTQPVTAKSTAGRSLQLHASLQDDVGWGAVRSARVGDRLWVERSFDGGATRTQPLAPVTATTAGALATGTVNLSDPGNHRRAVVRSCLQTPAGTTCTTWAYPRSCDTVCDGAPHGTATDQVPVADATAVNRSVRLHFDEHGAGWASISGATTGDRVWLDRSWNEGASIAGGSQLGVTTATGPTASTAGFVAAEPRLKLAGGSLRACVLVAAAQQSVCTAWARPSVDHAAAAADALAYSYDPYTAWWPSSWWNSAVAITTVVDYQRTTGDTRYTWMIDRTFEVNKGAFAAGVKSGDELPGGFVSRAIDDGGWWALAWIRAYDLTGDAKYLQMSESIGDYMQGYWDTSTCGGGVWWDGERTYKNAVVNGQYIEIAAELHNRIPGDSEWLSRAVDGWNWFQDVGLAGEDGLVNDGITDTCVNNGQTVYTYNQGLAIGGGVELWRATGDTKYLDSAKALADAAIHPGAGSPGLVVNGVLTQNCDPLTAANPCDDNAKQFKGVFMRYMTELDQATGGAYRTFDAAQAAAVWTKDRDALNRLGERWAGASTSGSPNVRDWRTQASALSALLSVR